MKADIEELYNQKGNFAKKIEEKFSMPYPLVILMFVLSLYGIGVLISVWLDSITAFLHSWTLWAGSVCLFVMTTVIIWLESSYLTMIFNARELFNVSDEIYYDWLQGLVARIYKPGLYILFGLPILLIGLQEIIRSCLYPPEPGEFWWGYPGLSIQLMASRLFVGYLVVWTIVVSLGLGFVTYLAIGVCYKVATGLGKLPIIFNFLHPDGMFGLKPLMTYFLKIMALYCFDASVASAVLLFSPDLGTYIFIALISLPGTVGFLIILYSCHKSLTISKTELLSEISVACSSYVKPPIHKRDDDRIQTMLLLFREIKNKSSWPININISAKTIGLFSSPTITFLAKILLSYLIPSAPIFR